MAGAYESWELGVMMLFDASYKLEARHAWAPDSVVLKQGSTRPVATT